MNRARQSQLIPAFVCLLATSAVSPTAISAETPKAEAILDKYVEVTGGKANYQKIHNEVSQGHMEFVGKGIRASLISYKAEPAKAYNVVELEGFGKIEQGTDGQIAWERSPLQGPRIKEGEEKAAALRDANIHNDWRDLFQKAEGGGIEDVGGRPCYKVILTPREGKPETRYYDTKTNLLVKVAKIVKGPMGEVPAEVFLSDYKEVDGILIPHTIRQRAIGQEFLIVLEQIQHNTKIPPDRFDLPDDVKALVEKSKGARTPGDAVGREPAR
jgi:hypothetical protein